MDDCIRQYLMMFSAALIATVAAGQTNPPATIDYAFAYLPAAGALMLHGGWGPPTWQPRNAAWALDQTGWHALSPTGAPAMMHHAAAYDSRRSVLVLCGRTGYGAPAPYTNETWEYSGALWQQTADLVSMYDGDVELAYDARRGVTVAYVADDTTSETWEYDATNWARIPTLIRPTANSDGALMRYDALAQQIVLLTTTNPLFVSDTYVSQTWSYDGSNWELRAQGLPTNAFGAGMACDEARSNLVLLTTDSETWTWNGETWTLQSPLLAPPPRSFFAMAYDPQRSVSVIFSGEAGALYPTDTWEWNGETWAEFVPMPEPGAARMLFGALLTWATCHRALRPPLTSDRVGPV